MQWKELIPTFDEYLLTRPRPQVLLIQLGSNDLAILKIKELIELIRLNVLRLQALFPELILIWREILPQGWGPLSFRQSVWPPNTQSKIP
jgi:hypothetical protein